MNKAQSKEHAWKWSYRIQRHLATGFQGNASPGTNNTEICDKIYQGWRTHPIYEGPCPNWKKFRDLALIKRHISMDQNLVEPKGDYELHLSLKSFFMVIFYNLEDKDRIFENSPYFYNFVGFYLRFWTDRLCPEKEDFTFASIWIHLYSLPQEFWLEKILMGIGNTLGRYVKSSEATKQRR
jgi:hypothetical protein